MTTIGTCSAKTDAVSGAAAASDASNKAEVLKTARELNKVSYVNAYAARNYLGQDEKAAKLGYRRRTMLLHPDKLPKDLTDAERVECSNAFAKLGEMHTAIFPKPTATDNSVPVKADNVEADGWQGMMSRLATELGNRVGTKAQEVFSEESVQAALGRANELGQAAKAGASALFSRVRNRVQEFQAARADQKESATKTEQLGKRADKNVD